MAATQAPETPLSAGTSPKPERSIERSGDALRTLRLQAVGWFQRPAVLSPACAFLRRFFPIVQFGNLTIVARYLDVVEVLRRDDAFHASPFYAPGIDRLDGPFILGLDRSPEYDRELALLHEIFSSADRDRIAQLVATEAALQIRVAENIGTRRSAHRIDVVAYARAVSMRVVADYFGMPGPLDALAGRLHDIFYDIFSNPTNDALIRARALASSAELRLHIDAEIAKRKAAGAAAKDDVLGRLIALQGAGKPWLDDATIRRNLTGMIVGTVDNTCKLLTLAVAQLLRRPNILRYARDAAIAGDVATIRRYVYEAARFDPPMPLLVRYARRETVLAAGTRRERTVKDASRLLLANLSALHDADGFEEPGAFNIDHDADQLLFGFGLHKCLGTWMNGVQIPELAAGLLRLPGLRCAAGRAGIVQFDGPFPSRLVLEWT